MELLPRASCCFSLKWTKMCATGFLNDFRSWGLRARVALAATLPADWPTKTKSKAHMPKGYGSQWLVEHGEGLRQRGQPRATCLHFFFTKSLSLSPSRTEAAANLSFVLLSALELQHKLCTLGSYTAKHVAQP